MACRYSWSLHRVNPSTRLETGARASVRWVPQDEEDTGAGKGTRVAVPSISQRQIVKQCTHFLPVSGTPSLTPAGIICW